jgi:hypothetical protein
MLFFILHDMKDIPVKEVKLHKTLTCAIGGGSGEPHALAALEYFV